MTRRLFFALWPAEGVRIAAAAAAEALAAGEGKPVPPSSYHLTLVFLGDVAEERVGDVVRAGNEVAAPPFDLELDCVGSFAEAHVTWLGCSRIPAELIALHERLSSALRSRTIALETRPYHPHLTLKRKVPYPQETTAIPPIRWAVNEFVLVESQSSEAGSKYHMVQRWSLSGEAK